MTRPSNVSFRWPVRVYYEDTDSGGVVYYANYLRFMERARSEWLRAIGRDVERLARDEGLLFAVRSVRVDFRAPARLSDMLAVTVEPASIGRASVNLSQRVLREDVLVCAAEVRLACLATDDFHPRPMPEPLRTELLQWTM
jgi:acyl-CoA thioester hydrolase